MHRTQPFALYVFLCAALAPVVAAQDNIPWITDVSQARQLAQQHQRPVLLHFWSESCAPCRELEQRVFNQPELIRSLANNYIPVKVNVTQQPRLADFYKIERIPTDVLVLPTGKEIYRTPSPSSANDYVAMLDQVRVQSGLAGGPSFHGMPTNVQLPALPSRDSGTDQELKPEPYNTDPRGIAEQSRATEGPASQFRPGVVQNEFALANGPAQRQPADVAPRYGNPYLTAEASSAKPAGSADNAIPSMPPSLPPSQTWEGTPPQTPPAASPTAMEIPQGNQATATAPTAAPDNSAATKAAPPTATITLPPNLPPLALDGYCPVSLVTMTKWVKGDPRWGVFHRGRTYLLATQADLQRFQADPDRYSPALSGYDPVRYAETRQLVDGRREFGVFYANGYYLFADETALVRFESQPQGYVQAVRQAMANTGTPQR
jgi:thioredoxin-related protein/YHS domain-containing protein